MTESACANCGAPLAGPFCSACGQKRLTERDRGLGHLLGEAFHKLTDLDGTLLRSLRLLLFRPGVLSREYMDDRRVRYASPISLFLLANVLYFFSPAMSDFNLSFYDQAPGSVAAQALDPSGAGYAARAGRLAHRSGQVHSRWTAPLIERKRAMRAAETPGYDLRQLARDYNQQSGIVGKVLIIVHVPLIALGLALVYWRQRRYFAEHFVVALHLFTFLLLFAQLLVAPLNWVGTHWLPSGPPMVGPALRISLTLLLCGYILLACRHAYRSGWGAALLGLASVLVGLLFGNILVYRALQFVVTLALV